MESDRASLVQPNQRELAGPTVTGLRDNPEFHPHHHHDHRTALPSRIGPDQLHQRNQNQHRAKAYHSPPQRQSDTPMELHHLPAAETTKLFLSSRLGSILCRGGAGTRYDDEAPYTRFHRLVTPQEKLNSRLVAPTC